MRVSTHCTPPSARVPTRAHRCGQAYSGMEPLLRRLRESLHNDCLEPSVQVTRSAVGTGSPPLSEPGLTLSARGPGLLTPPPHPQHPLHQSRNTAVPAWWLLLRGAGSCLKTQPRNTDFLCQSPVGRGLPSPAHTRSLALVHLSGLGARRVHTGLSKQCELQRHLESALTVSSFPRRTWVSLKSARGPGSGAWGPFPPA